MTVKRCLRLLRHGTLRPNKTTPSLNSRCPVELSTTVRPGTWIQTRGAKSKTTIKVSNLPQGALPPLPQDEVQEMEKDYPPLLRQHLSNMRKFPDCILLTRVGDFYELYFEHVDLYAPLVHLKKAKRTTARGDVAMAGFQHTQLDRYLRMFVQDHGKHVAISEQIRLPDSERSKSNGPMFDRQVTRVVTAGTLIDESFMDPYNNNYVLAIHVEDDLLSHEKVGIPDQARRSNTKIGLSWADVSSGDLYTQICDLASLSSVIARINPREIVLDHFLGMRRRTQLQNLLGDGAYSLFFHSRDAEDKRNSIWETTIKDTLPIEQQKEFTEQETAAGDLLLHYIRTRLRDMDIQFQTPIRRSDSEEMIIDRQALRGLEVRTTIKDNRFQGSLVHAVRQTVTKGGARLLNRRLVAPSMSLSVINSRLDLVETMLSHDGLREDIVSLLRHTFDTHRLLQKFSTGRGNPDDMLDLAKTIYLMQQIVDALQSYAGPTQDVCAPESTRDSSKCLGEIIDRMDLKHPMRLAARIHGTIDEAGLHQRQLVEENEKAQAVSMSDEVISADAAGEQIPKLSARSTESSKSVVDNSAALRTDDIWIMRKDASLTLSNAHTDLEDLLTLKQKLLARLKEELKIESLTLKWSAQLGHFCHVKGRDPEGKIAGNAHVRMIGATKSTRSFHHPDWTRLGLRIDTARAHIRNEEERVFDKLRKEVLENLMRLRRNSTVLDELDVACSSALIAQQRQYVRPILNNSTTHRIFGGRHPTVDAGLTSQGRRFTANDCTVGSPSERIYLITGPNMAGKSTYLRQNALITILAQTGLFVPAEYAELGLVDRIFSRIGSADDLYGDQSTFMVEMLETAEILARATPRSFVVMDEVGRGTTPEDGVAVAYACLRHLHDVNRCRTLFATHFHEVADMAEGKKGGEGEEGFEGLACYCTDVIEEAGGRAWTYAHRIRKGVNRDSHALKVARMAGVPERCIEVAAGVLEEFRRKRAKTGRREDGVEREVGTG